MYPLSNIKGTLKSLINNTSTISKAEFAIFDTNAHLIASTELYEQYKGKDVHSASIEEVLSEENVIVNRPGYMKSCKGCRFVNNCPATIEILSCIKLDSIPLGVINLTSFTQEGHERISKNTDEYMNILLSTSNLISTLIRNEEIKVNELILDKIIKDLILHSTENIVIINNNGRIFYCSPIVQDWYSFCDLYRKSIYQLFPENITSWLLDKKPTRKKYIINDYFSGNISSVPIILDNEIIGYIIKMEKPDKSKSHKIEFSNKDIIITKNKKMLSLKKKINKIANSPSSVLITGETGTGKEMFAKSIHNSSSRKHNPFIPINCANIPENLFESELFGYEEGAFTGAKKGGKPGIFEMANGGTILLDEIGELPLFLQAKLLRVLQENTIQRIGSLHSIPVDIRIIAATNRNLEEMLEEGSFREDLYYRLNVIPFYIPPLRERKDDVELLVYYFIKKYNKKLNKNIYSITPEALLVLKNYNWPGNIRELENIVEYSINIEEKNAIQLETLPKKLQNTSIDGQGKNNTLSNLEIDLIKTTLDKYGWDVKGKEKAATELGISLRTLYRKLEGVKYIVR